jgi:hypothetical protein
MTLQEIYEQAFDLPQRRIKDLPHRLTWLAALIIVMTRRLARSPATASVPCRETSALAIRG